jgi:hypothetical protein
MNIHLLSQLGLRGAVNVLTHNWAAVNLYYQLEAQLNGSSLARPLRRGHVMRKAGPEDIDRLQACLPALSADERRDLIARVLFYRRGFTRCFIVTGPEGDPVFMQWLLLPAENQLLQSQYPGRFPKLLAQDALIENAFCFPRYRAFGWLPEGTRRLMDHARRSGATRCIGLVRVDNLPALNTFTGLGFRIRHLVHETKMLGRARRQLERKPHEPVT